MNGQTQIQKGSSSSSSTSNASIKQKFEEIQTTPVTREVTLKYKSCCGCGCSDVSVQRTVPYDSPLQNGDRISELGPNDKMI